MTIADITLAIFGLCNTFRVLAYVPQIVKAATDKDGAKAISLATWALFLASHLSAAAYAFINANDWTLAGVFLSNAVGAGAILITAAIRRWQYKTREEVKLGSRMTRLAPPPSQAVGGHLLAGASTWRLYDIQASCGSAAAMNGGITAVATRHDRRGPSMDTQLTGSGRFSIVRCSFLKKGISRMSRTLAFAIATAAAALSVPATAQNALVGPEQPCVAAFDKAGYLPLTRFVPEGVPASARTGIRGVVARSSTWKPGETIRVCFHSGSQKVRARVAGYAVEWMKYAKITFDFGDMNNLRSCSNDPKDAIKIDFIEQGPAAGYWSARGTFSLKVPHSMNLADIGREVLRVPEPSARATTIHEFGHALGLVHEHQSPKAGCNAEYYADAVIAYGAVMGWPPDRSIANFAQVPDVAEYNATEVDRKSVMHYSLPPWLFKSGEKSPCYVPRNYEISEGDKAFIARIYPKTEVVATRSVTSRTLVQQRAAIIEEYRAQLAQAGVEKGKAARLVKEFSETLPTR